MIVIRAAQLALFGAERRRGFEKAMLLHLRTQFAAECTPYRDHALLRHVREALADAAAHGLYTERDCARYLNLALLYGWDFLQRADCAWMLSYLADTRVQAPGDRLDRLVKECLKRRAQERERVRLAIELGLGFDDNNDDDVRPALKASSVEALEHD